MMKVNLTGKKWYPWLVVGLLWIVALLNYMDRQMLSTMQEAMKADIVELRKAEAFGALMAVFLWVYAVLSPFAGMVADKVSRKWLIVGSLVVWSAVTFIMGYASTFRQLYVLRALMGISEALYIPSALSLIADWHENKWKFPGEIVAANHLVFAINSDHFIYRVARTHDPDGGGALGLVIRNGEILFEKQKNPASQAYPPLDIMALYPDGSVRVFVTKDLTGKEILSTGATDTLSFGPILVQDGEISVRSKQFGETFQPRTAFGTAEPGHYIAVVVEGRSSGHGQSCIWLAQKMQELGCLNAINLDGGGTAAMVLMGVQINKSGNFGGQNHRLVNEGLGIGYSENVQPGD